MKSAIFLELERPNKPRAFRKTLPQKKAKSLLPYTPNTAPGSPASTSSAIPKSSPWNAEDMISLYISLGTLPQLLLPTLPPQFAKPGPPETAKRGNVHSDQDDDLPNGLDIDNFPISLLSPTLPTMFEPKAEKTDASGEISASRSPKKASSVLKSRVRWANKLNDPKRPRFVVRISLLSLKLGAVSTPKLKGLGITEIDLKALALSGSSKRPPPSQWRKIAKTTIAHSDRIKPKDPLFALVVQFDYILCLAIAGDYDEKADLADSTHTKNAYKPLLDEIPPFVSRIDKYIKTHNVQDKKKAYLSFLVGVLTNLKALAIKRILESLKLLVRALPDSKDKIIDLQMQIITYYKTITDTLAEAQTFFTLCPSPSTVFPKSWHNRSTPVQKPNPKLPLNPSTDKYYAPLGSYSDLRDACGYLYCCLREFMELYGSEMNDGVKYAFQSGKKQ